MPCTASASTSNARYLIFSPFLQLDGKERNVCCCFLPLPIRLRFNDNVRLELLNNITILLTSLIQKKNCIACLILGKKCLKFTKPKSSNINKRELWYTIKSSLILNYVKIKERFSNPFNCFCWIIYKKA